MILALNAAAVIRTMRTTTSTTQKFICVHACRNFDKRVIKQARERERERDLDNLNIYVCTTDVVVNVVYFQKIKEKKNY